MTTQLDGDAVNQVAALARQAATVQREKIGKYEYADRPMVRLNLDPALPTSLEFLTLAGFVRFVLAEAETADAMIHVVSPTLVTAISKLEGSDNHLRRRYGHAVFQQTADHAYELNSYEPLEDLVIALQTEFDRDLGDCTELLKFCSSVRATASVGAADDGVSQTIEAKRGVAAVLTTAVKNPWSLARYRTFAEVEQPLSPYVLRFQNSGIGMPTAALFETGDQGWRITAVEAIAKYLRVALPDHEVLG